MLDVLGDTMQWLNWGQFFGPLSGHESKLDDEERRQILTTFAYGTGLGPTQVAKSVSGVSDRQIAFVNQRHVTTEKLEAAISEVINGYNRFWLPKLWGDAKRAAALAAAEAAKQPAVEEAAATEEAPATNDAPAAEATETPAE